MNEDSVGEERILTPDIISEETAGTVGIDLMPWEAFLEAYRLKYSLIRGEVLIARGRIRNCLHGIWEANRNPYAFANHPQVNMVEQAYGLNGLKRIVEKRDPKSGNVMWQFQWQKVLPDGFFGKRGKALAELRDEIEDIEETIRQIKNELPLGAEDFF